MKLLLNTAEIKENCNSRNWNNCPLEGKWSTSNIIYKAQITSNHPQNRSKICIGSGYILEQNSKKDLRTSRNLSTSNTMKTGFISKVNWRIKKKCATLNLT